MHITVPYDGYRYVSLDDVDSFTIRDNQDGEGYDLVAIGQDREWVVIEKERSLRRLDCFVSRVMKFVRGFK